jgi:hypothetical protein
MEHEKPNRYIYNPFVLNALYQKIDYASRVRLLHAQRQGQIFMGESEHVALIRDNLFNKQVVADLYHLLEAMRVEAFCFDVYHCNYDYALYRLYRLLLAVAMEEGTSGPPCDINDNGQTDWLPIEYLIMEFIARDSESTLVTALDRYVTRYCSPTSYDNEAVKRTSLLFNIKHKLEAKVGKKQNGDPDYRIEYNRETVLSMLYVFLVNEFLALYHEEASQLRTSCETYRAPRDYSDRDERAREMEQCARKIALVGDLARTLWQHLKEEFVAQIAVFPAQARLRSTAEHVLQRYVMTAPGQQKTVYRVKDLATEAFVVREKQCNHIRYMTLRKSRVHYENVASRLIFDHLLLQSHVNCGGGGAQQSPNVYTLYTRCCQVCNYMLCPDSLHEFYEASTAHTYYLCEYVKPSNTSGGGGGGGEKPPCRETLLTQYLASMIVDPVVPLVSLVYKNAAQALVLFRDRYRDTGVQLFHIVNINHIIQYLIDQYMTHEGGPEARQRLVLGNKWARYGSMGGTARVERWQKDLARDIDIYCLMMLAIDAQASEIEKYERTMRDFDETSATTTTSQQQLNLSSKLVGIYAIYISVLENKFKVYYAKFPESEYTVQSLLHCGP